MALNPPTILNRAPALLAITAAAVLIIAGLGTGLFDSTVTSQETTDDPVPRGIHLSWTDDPYTTLTVQWFTDGPIDPGSTVEWGSSVDDLSNSATGGTEKALGADTDDDPTVDTILIHTATMTGLTPGQPVFYRVGGEGAWSEVIETKGVPAEGESFRIVAFGDQGTTKTAEAVNEDVIAANPDLVVILGDIAYADDWDNQHRWDFWYNMAEPYASRVPVMVTPGNHESFDWQNGEENATAYKLRVAMPGNEFFFTWEYNGLFFLGVPSDPDQWDVDFSRAEMIAFADEALATAKERKEAGELDHVIVYQHHQIFSNHKSSSRQFNRDLITWEEPLLQQHEVDMLWVGHNHHYERTYPMIASIPTTFDRTGYQDEAGYIELISGGGGRGLYDFSHPDDFYPFNAEWAQQHHYMTVDVDGPTMTFKAIASVFQSAVLDTFTVTADNAEPSEETPRPPLLAP